MHDDHICQHKFTGMNQLKLLNRPQWSALTARTWKDSINQSVLVKGDQVLLIRNLHWKATSIEIGWVSIEQAHNQFSRWANSWDGLPCAMNHQTMAIPNPFY